MMNTYESFVRELGDEINRLRDAIRKHRDQRSDDGELYAVLPEGDTRLLGNTTVLVENKKNEGGGQ